MNSERAFTVTMNGLANQLVSFVGVSLPNNPADSQISQVIEFKGIWDTGATVSVITTEVVNKLNLRPVGKTLVQGVTGSATRDRFVVDFYLPNKVIMPLVSVTECDGLTGDFDILIGMDIMNHGDFAVTNYLGKTKFSFRTPSMEEIDFVKSIKLSELKKVTNRNHYYGQKISPNAKCLCGSGKKYKKCHGS